jgi:hypothetical protein
MRNYKLTLLESGVNWKAGWVLMPCGMSVQVATQLSMPNHSVYHEIINTKKYFLITFMSQHVTFQRCIETVTKFCGKTYINLAISFFMNYVEQSKVKAKMLMCPKVFMSGIATHSLTSMVSESTNCVRQKVASYTIWKFMLVHTKQTKNITCHSVLSTGYVIQ